MQNKTTKKTKRLAALCFTAVFPLSIFLAGCSPAMSSGPATDPTPDEAQEEIIEPKALNSSFELGYRIVNELPSECRLSDDEMKNSIDGYVSFINGRASNSLSVHYGESGSVEMVDGNSQPFRSFDSVRDCFAYLYECHQVTVNGVVSGFAQGNSYSEYLEGGVYSYSNGEHGTETDTDENITPADQTDGQDEPKLSSGNAAKFADAEGAIGVNFPNATISNGENIGSIGISIGGSATTNIMSLTTGYTAPSSVSIQGFTTKEVRIKFNNDINDADMSNVLANIMILASADNGTTAIPVIWTIYDLQGNMVKSVNSGFDYSRLAG